MPYLCIFVEEVVTLLGANTDKCPIIQAAVEDEGHYLSKAGGLSTYTAICASRQIQRYFKSQNLLTGNDHVAPPI